MRNIILILAFSLTCTSNYAQSDKALRLYEQGNSSMSLKDYRKAIEFFSASIKLVPDEDTYFNRAAAYFYLGDTCNFCRDLNESIKVSYDDEAVKLYKENCSYISISNEIADSIKRKHPTALHLEIVHKRCSADSTINVVVNDNGVINSVELVKRYEGLVYTIVEDMPVFEGGQTALQKYIADNLHYPEIARQAMIQGTSYIQFIVESDGSVSDIRLLRGIGGGCDEEAIRLVRKMPKWIPGKQNGKPVRVKYNMPISFTL